MKMRTKKRFNQYQTEYLKIFSLHPKTSFWKYMSRPPKRLIKRIFKLESLVK